MFNSYSLSLVETVSVNVTCKRLIDYLYVACNIKTRSAPTEKCIYDFYTKVDCIC